MLEDLGIEFDSDNGEVQEMLPLPNINSIILKKVIDWCRYHVNDEEPMEEDHGENKGTQRKQRQIEELCDWDKGFVKVDKGILFDIILAANYLHIQGLINMACATVAKMLMNKSQQQIRKEFNIKNHFTPNPGFEDDLIFEAR